MDLLTKLDRVEQRSRQDKRTVFNNLGHLINLGMLEHCYHSQDGSKAVGNDGVTKEEYGKNLEENLRDLLLRIRRGSYHPKASRIVEIPKPDGSMRPLAISCFEDKIVQEATRIILERITEPMFLAHSHGFRPGKGCDTALKNLREDLMRWECGAVLEIDLRKYFNSIPHEQLIRLLKMKISDERFLWLIIKQIKAPTIDENGKETRNEIGSPQGSILSPVLANLYLHYVLDVWFNWINQKEFNGEARTVRYADDAVFTFGTLEDAEKFKSMLVERLNQWGIQIHEGKTGIMPAGKREAQRHAEEGKTMPSFFFLGFLFVWGQSIQRSTGQKFWRVKLRTDPKRFRKKLKEVKEFIRKNRHQKNLIPKVTRGMQGYTNYFAVNDNLKAVYQMLDEVRGFLWKYLNRRSQRRSLSMDKLIRILTKLGYPRKVRPKNLFFNLRCTGSKPAMC